MVVQDADVPCARPSCLEEGYQCFAVQSVIEVTIFRQYYEGGSERSSIMIVAGFSWLTRSDSYFYVGFVALQRHE